MGIDCPSQIGELQYSAERRKAAINWANSNSSATADTQILGLFKAQYVKSLSTRQQTTCWKCGTVSPSGIIFGVATVDAYQLTVFYVAIRCAMIFVKASKRGV